MVNGRERSVKWLLQFIIFALKARRARKTSRKNNNNNTINLWGRRWMRGANKRPVTAYIATTMVAVRYRKWLSLEERSPNPIGRMDWLQYYHGRAVFRIDSQRIHIESCVIIIKCWINKLKLSKVTMQVDNT